MLEKRKFSETMEVSFGANYIGGAGAYYKKAMASNKKHEAMEEKYEGWTSQKTLAAGEPGQAPDALGCKQSEQRAEQAMVPARQRLDAGKGKEVEEVLGAQKERLYLQRQQERQMPEQQDKKIGAKTQDKRLVEAGGSPPTI